MATRTRRLDVEIGSEAKGSGFKDTANAADKMAKAFKDAGDKAGKGLTDGVDEGADKLRDKLRTKGKQAGDRFGEGLKSGLDSANATMESAGSNAADLFSSGFDPGSIADMIPDALSGVTGKLGIAAGSLGLAAGTAFVVGLMNGMETEVATDRLAAQLGGSEWAEDMGQVAGDLYLDGFGESVADTGAAVREVVQNHLLPEDAGQKQVEALTGRFLTFTDVMEQDMDMATQAVSNMLRTGIADSGTEALNILTRGIQQGADRAGDLAETFQEYSTMFRDIGISAQDATGLLVQGLQAGARDADTVADALKEFAIRAQDGSDTSAQGFKAIGLNAKEMTAAVAEGGPAAKDALDQVLDGLRNMEDPVDRNAAAVALFGTKAEDLGDALFNLDLDTAARGLGDTAGATDDLSSAYDNASSRIETFKRQGLQRLTEFIGNGVLPALAAFGGWVDREIVPALQTWGEWLDVHIMPTLESLGNWIVGTALPALGEFAQWLGRNKDVLAAVGIGLAAVGAAILVSLVPAFLAWAVSAAAAAAATILAAAPLILLGLAVAAFAYLVINNWDTIKNATAVAFDFVKNKIAGAFNWVKNNWPLLLAILTGPIGLAVLAIARNWETIKSGATAVKNWIRDRFDDVVSFVSGLGGRISDAASGMWDGIADAFRSAINAVIGIWNGLQIPGISIHQSLPGPIPDINFDAGPWDLPNISPLAEGGIVRHRPGGILANIGEGRHDEAVIPLDGRNGMGDTYVTNVYVEGSVLTEQDLVRRLNGLGRGGRGLN